MPKIEKGLGALPSLDPSQIRKDDLSVPYLVLRQMDRVAYLQTLGIIGQQTPSFVSEDKLAYAIKRGLRSIESFLYPFLTKDYREGYKDKTTKLEVRGAEDIKSDLKSASRIDNDYFELLADWQDLLVKELGQMDMLPTREVEMVWE